MKRRNSAIPARSRDRSRSACARSPGRSGRRSRRRSRSGRERAQVAQVGAELLGRHGRVLPALPARRRARDARGGAERGFAQPPDGCASVAGSSYRATAGGCGRLRRGPRAPAPRPPPPAGPRRRIRPAASRRPAAGAALLRMYARAPELRQQVVHPTSSADRAETPGRRHVVGRLVDVGIAEDEPGPGRRAVHEARRWLRGRHARALGAHERAGDVEAVFGQELVQVVARDAAGDVGEPRADQSGVVVAQRAQPGVDLAAAAAGGDDPRELVVARRPDRAGAAPS